MAHETIRKLVLHICAPIPIGHEVIVQYFEKDTAVIATKFELIEDEPAVVDRTTGVVYGAAWHPASFFEWSEPVPNQYERARPAQKFEGTVRACAVLTGHTKEGNYLVTVLTIDTSGVGYR